MDSAQGKAPQPSETAHSRAERPIYSPEQIAEYLAFIALPESQLSSPLLKDSKLARSEDDALPFLTTLMRYHMAMVPFENIALHYSQGRVATLDTDELFDRFVQSKRHLGGYCFQQNAFFGTVLSSLGFEVMATAARVNTAVDPAAKYPNYKGPSYNPWNHMALVITMSGCDYLVDVGMHSQGPIVPVKLGFESVTSIAPRKVRLTRACIPEHVSRRKSNELWLFEVCNGDGQAWVPTYCFAMMEFLPADFDALNWWVSTSKKSWFTHSVICGKLLLNESGAEIVGDLTLFGSGLRRRIHGKVELQISIQSEEQRVALLDEHFGIKLKSHERQAITMTEAQVP